MTHNPYLILQGDTSRCGTGVSVRATTFGHRSREGFSVMIVRGPGAGQVTGFFGDEMRRIASESPGVFNPCEEAWKSVEAGWGGAEDLSIFEADMMGGWFMERTAGGKATARGNYPVTLCRLSFGCGGREASLSTPVGYPGTSVHDKEMFLFGTEPMRGTEKSVSGIRDICTGLYRAVLASSPGDTASSLPLPTGMLVILDLRAVLRDMELSEVSPQRDGLPLIIREEGRRTDINGRVIPLSGGTHYLPAGRYRSRLPLLDIRCCMLPGEEICILLHPREMGEDTSMDNVVRLSRGEEVSLRMGARDEGDREGIRWWSDLYDIAVSWTRQDTGDGR